MNAAEIRGDRTGRIWRYHPTADRIDGAGSGERFRIATVDDGSLAYLHRLTKEDDWRDDVARMQHAIEVASRPPIAAAPTIRRLLDVHDATPTPGPWSHPGWMSAIWEWADISLHEFLAEPDDDRQRVADAVGRNVRAALEVLHAEGLIHADVAPNNILRVDRVWKLADLDSVTALDVVPERQPQSRFVHPDRAAGAPAREEFDYYGLEKTLELLRS